MDDLGTDDQAVKCTVLPNHLPSFALVDELIVFRYEWIDSKLPE